MTQELAIVLATEEYDSIVAVVKWLDAMPNFAIPFAWTGEGFDDAVRELADGMMYDNAKSFVKRNCLSAKYGKVVRTYTHYNEANNTLSCDISFDEGEEITVLLVSE